MKRTLMAMLRRQWFLRELLSSLICASMVLAPCFNYASPVWWPEHSVLDLAKTPEDYAAANIGQVKALARKAMEALDQRFAPSGAGLAIHNMVNGWNTSPEASRADYAVVNLGQLKNVVRPFYDRLAAVGARPPGVYPWTDSVASARDYAPANIGQVKNVFAFDLENLAVWTYQSTQKVFFITFGTTGGGTGDVELGQQRELQIFAGYHVSETWTSNFGGTETRNYRVEPASFAACSLSINYGDGQLDTFATATDSEGNAGALYTGGKGETRVNLSVTRSGTTRTSHLILRPEWAYGYTTRWVTGEVTVPEGTTDVPFEAVRDAHFAAQLHSKDLYHNAQGAAQWFNEQSISAEGAEAVVSGGSEGSRSDPPSLMADENGEGVVALTQGTDGTQFYFGFYKDGVCFGTLTTYLQAPAEQGILDYVSSHSSIEVEVGPSQTATVYPGHEDDIYANVKINRWERWKGARGYINQNTSVAPLEGAEVRFIPYLYVEYPGVTLTEAELGKPYYHFYPVTSDYAGQATVRMRSPTIHGAGSNAVSWVDVSYIDNTLPDSPLLTAHTELSWSISEPPPPDDGGDNGSGGTPFSGVSISGTGGGGSVGDSFSGSVSGSATVNGNPVSTDPSEWSWTVSGMPPGIGFSGTQFSGVFTQEGNFSVDLTGSWGGYSATTTCSFVVTAPTIYTPPETYDSWTPPVIEDWEEEEEEEEDISVGDGPGADAGDEGSGPTDGGPVAEITGPPGEEEEAPGEPPAYTVSTSDAAGPRYRKISLQGIPMPDSKPQEQNENGEPEEETYVDAFSGELRHSVSDVYVAIEGAELPLMVRRDAAVEGWQLRSGLLPEEMPDLPFGGGWRTNICSYVRFEDNKRATVVDEMGSPQSFLHHKDVNGLWLNPYEETTDIKSCFNNFNAFWDGQAPTILGNRGYNYPLITLTKKNGTICRYEMCPGVKRVIKADKLMTGSEELTFITYARLTEVEDRMGNKLVYEYEPSSSPEKFTLIPSCIYDPARSAPGAGGAPRTGHRVLIETDADKKRVVSVTAPGGQKVTYSYQEKGVSFEWVPDRPNGAINAPVLIEVKKLSGTPSVPDRTVNYNYSMRANHGTPIGEKGVPGFGTETTVYIAPHHVSLDLWKIQNESGWVYEFVRTAPSPRYTYHSQVPTKRLQLGAPWPISQVNCPEGQSFSLQIYRYLNSKSGQNVEASAVTSVLNGAAGQYQYVFSQPCILRPYGDPVNDDDPNSQHVSLGYEKMEIINPLNGRETFLFDSKVSMALKSATDLSGNETRFVYANVVAPYDDPLKEINALGGEKVFTYDDEKVPPFNIASRILTSMRDESGVRTSYALDSKKRRTMELVESANETDLKKTVFVYDSTAFPGFVTQKRTSLIGDDDIPYSQSPARESKVEYVPDAQGRVWQTKTFVNDTEFLTTETTYTLNGDKLTEKDGMGNVTSYQYDPFRHLTKVTHPDGSFKTMSYDLSGNMVSETNEVGVKTFYAYDQLGRRIRTTVDVNGNGQPDLRSGTGGPSYSTMQIIASAPSFNGDIVTQTTFNARSQIVTQTDGRGKVTSNDYDAIGRLMSTTDGDRTTVFTYSGANTGGGTFDVSGFKPTTVSEPNGLVTINEYDKLYRNTKKTREGASTTTTYDAMGRVLTVIDARGRTTTSMYDLLGNLVKTTYPDLSSQEKWYTHDAKPYKAQSEKGALHQTLTIYDRAGRVVQVQAPSPATDSPPPVTTTEYDSNGNVIKVIDPLGRITETDYDSRNRPVAVMSPPALDVTTGDANAVAVTETFYDATGKVIKVKDANGGETRKFYDPAGRVWKVLDHLGNATLTTYDAGGNVISVTDQEGQTSTSVYDLFNKVTAKTDAEGITTSYEYDAAGNQTKITDGLGRSTVSVFDLQNRLLSQQYENGDKYTYVYNAVHKTSAKDPSGNVTRFEYDLRDRQTQTRFYTTSHVPTQVTVQVPVAGVNVCDLGGSVMEGESHSATATARMMDEEGAPSAGVESWTWSVTGSLPPGITFQDGVLSGGFSSSGSYTFTLTASANGISGSTTSTITVYPPPFEEEPAPETYPPQSGIYPAYTPPTEAQQQTVMQAVENWQFTRFTEYDLEGNVTSITEPGRPWAAVTYEYDRLGRRVAETSQGVRHTYVFDRAGNETSATYGTGSKVVTSYDSLNRPISMTETKADGSGTPRITKYGYDKGGRAIQLLSANGQVTRNSYDATGRLLRRTLYRDASSYTAQVFQSRFDYTYDKTGNVTSQAESWPGTMSRQAGTRTTSMVYDDAGRLMTEIIDDPEAAQDMTTVYGYDDANNRTNRYVSGGQESGYWTYEHNNANQLVGWSKLTALEGTVLRSAELTYDGNGNRTSQTVTGVIANGGGIAPPNVANGTTTYEWDFMNRLVRVEMPSGRNFEYQYDYRSRRVGISDAQASGTTYTKVVFSEGLSVAEYEDDAPIASTAGLTPEVQYVRGTDMGGGIGGMLYTLRDDQGVQTAKYDLSNGRGDVVAQSNSGGDLTWTASYEAFGRRTKETGVNEDKQRANSKDEDPTGLLNEGFRYRDLETGVFLSRDPKGTVDGPNVYTYVNQNPWTKFDPEGLFWHIAVAGLIGAALSVGAQIVSDVVSGQMSDASTYASAAVGGAVTGATLAATGSPTLAGAAGGAAASATKQFVANGTIDGGQVLKDAAVGAVEGGMGGALGKAIGCAGNKALKALGGAAVDAATGAGGQIVDNAIEGKPLSEGVADAALGSLPGAGLVTAVQQRESCFLAGTSVTLGSGDKQAIETLVIGQRVLTPESTTQTADTGSWAGSETQVDPATWRSYTVRLRDARTGWDIFDITLLRPAGWMAEHSRPLGGGREVWVDFEELNAKGWAEVIEERPCPKVAEGPGRVVTATITHANDDVRTLTMSSGETLYVTGNHRMFSATRQDWVAVKDLRIGEELRTANGRESVATLGYQRGRHQVYNIEVEDEHCYFVGNREVLTHNMCGPDGESLALTHSDKGSSNNGLPQKNANGGVDFEGTDAMYSPKKGQANSVDIEYTGSRRNDFKVANNAAKTGTGEKPPRGYTWHHLDNYNNKTNKGTMQLVTQKAHRATYPHKGGVAQFEKAKKRKYKR